MSSSTTEPRASHPSREQVQTLISIMENRLDLAKGFAKTLSAREKAKKDWYRICLKLNNIPGTTKTMRQWTKYWSDKKNAVKKKLIAMKAQQEGLSGDLSELHEFEIRILKLIEKSAKATTSQLYRQSIKKELLEDFSIDDQNEDESSQSNVVQAFLLDEPVVEETVLNDCNNQSEEDEVFVFHGATEATEATQKQQNNIPTNSSPKLSSTKAQTHNDLLCSQPFAMMVKKLCHIEQQRLELDKRMLGVIERNSRRDYLLTHAVKAMGEGLKALAEAISKK